MRSARLVAVALAAAAALPAAPAAGAAAPAGSAFRTLPPGSALPAAAACARAVRRHPWEPRPHNAVANGTLGARLVLSSRTWRGFRAWRRLAGRVDGAFTGTTDEILQWASCKWGFDEDVTRAQAYVESRWNQAYAGDGGASVGILQVKSARAGTPHRYTWPHSRLSTAYNADYALAWRRACFEGHFAPRWLPASARGRLWGCVGLWFSGAWRRGDAGYVAKVQRALRRRPWVAWGWPGR
jgi:hypothetical protein